MSLNVFIINMRLTKKVDLDFEIDKENIFIDSVYYEQLAKTIRLHAQKYNIELKTLNLFFLTHMFDSKGLAIFPETTTETFVGINYFIYKLISKLFEENIEEEIEKINCQCIAIKIDSYNVKAKFEEIVEEYAVIDDFLQTINDKRGENKSSLDVFISQYHMNFYDDEHLDQNIFKLILLLTLGKNDFTLPDYMKSNQMLYLTDFYRRHVVPSPPSILLPPLTPPPPQMTEWLLE